ncbi:MAG: anti-sigma factor [Candidatus Dormibacteria bacterium]
MNCEEVETLLAIHAVGGLEPDEVSLVSQHLAGCVACQKTGEAFARSAALLPLALPQRTPPAGLRHRLMADVYAEAAGRPLRLPLTRRVWGRLPTGRPFGRPFAFAAGLAAAAAVTLIALVPGIGRSTPATPGSRTVAVTLHGTTAMPLAHGVLAYDPQRHEAIVTVEGLTRQSSDGTAAAPPIYELWLIRPNTAAVPAGVLSLGPDGQTWMAAMRMNAHDYQSLAATIEPAGGSSAPTGPEVLQAQLSG